jgi:protease-4
MTLPSDTAEPVATEPVAPAASDTVASEPAASQRPHLVAALAHLRRSRRLWRILFVIALIVAAVAIGGRFAMQAGETSDQIARIAIDGTIITDRTRLRAIERIAEDDRVKAVIVAINSPGGSTAGGEELYETLSMLREKKPVVAVIRELGASAAYMTAIAADRVFSRRLSIVGSIGVLYQHVNAGKLLDTIGIDLEKIATGPLKAEPDFDEPISPIARQSLQALVDDSFEWFVDIVAERRNLERPAALALADGRIVTGRVGIATGLIDAVGGEAEAIAWLEAEKDIAADLPILTWFPTPSGPFDITQWLGGEMRSALGLVPSGPIALDGLVSLWQVGPT